MKKQKANSTPTMVEVKDLAFEPRPTFLLTKLEEQAEYQKAYRKAYPKQSLIKKVFNYLFN